MTSGARSGTATRRRSAARYIAGGARWIHVVDLDGARTGVAHERAVLGRIVGLARAAGVSVEFGGGIRSEDDAADVLESGVARVVLGTAALEEPALAGRCARRWPGRIAVGLDYRVGEDGVAEAQAQGWLAGSGHAVHDLLELWEKEPIGAVVATSVARDGMLSGPDLAGLQALLAATSLPVVASGGVARRRRPEGAGRPRRREAAAWPAPSWARRSWRAG